MDQKEIDNIANNTSPTVRKDIRYLLIRLNDAGVLTQASFEPGEHVPHLRIKKEDGTDEKVEASINRLNDLIDSLENAGILE